MTRFQILMLSSFVVGTTVACSTSSDDSADSDSALSASCNNLTPQKLAQKKVVAACVKAASAKGERPALTSVPEYADAKATLLACLPAVARDALRANPEFVGINEIRVESFGGTMPPLGGKPAVTGIVSATVEPIDGDHDTYPQLYSFVLQGDKCIPFADGQLGTPYAPVASGKAAASCDDLTPESLTQASTLGLKDCILGPEPEHARVAVTSVPEYASKEAALVACLPVVTTQALAKGDYRLNGVVVDSFSGTWYTKDWKPVTDTLETTIELIDGDHDTYYVKAIAKPNGKGCDVLQIGAVE